jgi:predicted RNase H-like nuclease (RuvC/YqgF family)
MEYSSDLAMYKAEIANYNNQIKENQQKILNLENEIIQMKDISGNIENLKGQIPILVNTYINLVESSDFKGRNEKEFSDKQDNIKDDTQNYLDKIDNTIIADIFDEISYKMQKIASLNAHISALESLKMNLRVPKPSDYD